MAISTIKFSATKAFGFIQPQDGGKVVFVDIAAIQAAGLDGLDHNAGQQCVGDDMVGSAGGQIAQGHAGILQQSRRAGNQRSPTTWRKSAAKRRHATEAGLTRDLARSGQKGRIEFPMCGHASPSIPVIGHSCGVWHVSRVFQPAAVLERGANV